jgi:hypothetical protein
MLDTAVDIAAGATFLGVVGVVILMVSGLFMSDPLSTIVDLSKYDEYEETTDGN